MEEIYLRFPANIRYLHLATSLCRELCTKVPRKRKVKDYVEDIELCISEACTNAIKYGSGRELGTDISVCFQLFPDRVTIQVGDQGEGFDLDNIPVPDLDIHPERGYGLYIIKAKMDAVRYVRCRDGNYLEMTRYFDTPFNNRSS
jgi:serine/threonine-protein kinase RsbW